jgi:putative pyrroloquinoline-quinone-binding quinoprotein
MKFLGMLFILSLLALAEAQAAEPVLTRSYDNGRTGANTKEKTLTPQLVATKGLKKIKSLQISDDLRVEAQPLYAPGLKIKNVNHNVVFVASMANHVFAFDADAPEGQDLLWTSPVLSPPYNPIAKPANNPMGRETNVDLWGINNLWGILSTPVVDLDANQMYLVNWTEGPDPNNPVLLLHRIRLDDGTEIGQGKPLTGSLSVGGQVVRDARGALVQLHSDQKQRAALLLSPLRGAHKTLFIGITGGEVPGDPHGWMVAVDVDTFQQTAAIPTTQQGFGGGIWQGAQGPASDDHGNVYVMTGNGGFNARKQGETGDPGRLGDFNGSTDFGEAFVKFNYQKTGNTGTLTLNDWFIPFQDSKRTPNGDPDYQDQDLGSGGPILPNGTNLLLGAGKDGILYVLDRTHLGKKIDDVTALKQPPIAFTFNGTGLTVAPPSDFPLGGGPDPGQGAPRKTHHLHASPVYWVGPSGPRLFDWGENESLRSWSIDPKSGAAGFLGKGAEVASRAMALDSTTIGGMTGGMTSLSSDGTKNGIVWTLAPIDANANQAAVAGIARAYDATAFDGTNADTTQKIKLLWDSTKSGVTFTFSKFCPPVVADGKVYVATYDGRVDVYALNP